LCDSNIFVRWGHQPHVQPPTWTTRVSHLVWVITFDLSGMESPTISYATHSIALSMSASVCLLAYLSSMPCACTILSPSSLAPPHFSTLSHKRHDFRGKKKSLNVKCVF
jgi:hypothetical protein